MRTLKTSEAAALLQVSPNTLRAWERRYDYPRPRRTVGRHRLYTHAEISALGNALRAGLSIQSAISRCRESISVDADALVAALATLDVETADLAMKSALALRTFACCIEDVLLRSLDELADEFGDGSATWALAARWADGWLRRAQRLAAPPRRQHTVLLGDAGCEEIDRNLLALRAWQLFCERAGVRVVSLPVRCVEGLVSVSERLAPNALVIAGNGPSLDHALAWAQRVQDTAGPLPRALFRCPHLTAGGTAEDAWVLPNEPHAAQRDLLERLLSLHEVRPARL